MATRTITIAFNGDTKGLDRAAQQGGQAVDGWKGKFQKFNKVAVAASLAVVAGAGKLAVDLKSRSQEITSNMALAEAAFGDQLPAIEAWADTIKRSMGMSRQEVIAMVTNSQDLMVGFGMAEDAAADLTKKNTELAQALAASSGGTIDVEQAMEALTKAATGETEGLKALGTVINQDMIKAQLRKKGLEDLEGMERKQAEAIAIHELALEQNQHKVDLYNNGLREQMENQNGAASSMAQLKDNLAQALTPAFEKFDKILSSVAAFVEKNQDLVFKLGAAVVGLAGFVLAANAAWKVYMATKKAWILLTKTGTAVMKAFNLVMRANPIGLVITAVGLLVAGFIYLWNNVEGFKAFFLAAWEAIQAAVSAVLDWFTGTLWPGIQAVWDGIIAGVQALWAGIQAAWNAVLATTQAVWGAIKAAITAVWNAIKAAFTAALSAIRTVVTSYFNAYKALITTVLNAVRSVVTAVWNAIRSTIQAVLNAIRSVVSSVFNAIRSTISSVMNAVRSVVSSVWGAIRGVFSGAVNGIKSVVSGGFNAVKNLIVTPVNAAKNLVKGAIDGIAGFFSGLPGRIRSGFSTLGSAISSPFRSALNGIKSLWNSSVGKISFKVPGWVPGIGGKGWSFPRLATGGFLRPGQTALVGEQGPELLTMLGGGGKVTPNHELGGGSNVQVNVQAWNERFSWPQVKGELRGHGVM